MPGSRRKQKRVFISHASVNLNVAQEVDTALRAAGLRSWLDHSDIHIGVLLVKELQQAITASQAVVLLWSAPAAASRWVKTEVLAAFHSDRFIIPCVLSATELPQFLSRSVYFDLRKGRPDALKRIGEQAKRAPRSRNEFMGVRSYQDSQLKQAINRIHAGQAAAMRLVDSNDLRGARKLQARLDVGMRAAMKRWRYDPTILNLAGYHFKNAYMLKHWEEYCAGRFPNDSLRDEGEKRFLETLLINPLDYSALNGLGNILFFKGELDAAEFFMERAVTCAKNDGIKYVEAEQDLALTRKERL